MRVVLTIPGKPFAKQRPKFVRATGRAFTPKDTVNFEAVVQQIALQQFKTPMEGPVRLTVHATFEVAASWSRAKRQSLIGKPHVQRPDTDNCVKAVSDGLNRVAFADDSQIAELVASKRWGRVASTVVIIETLEDEEDARLAADVLG